MDIKPQAMALPKDTSTLPQGKYGPDLSQNTGMPRVHDHREDYSRPRAGFFTSMPKTSRKQWLQSRIVWRHSNFTIFVGSSFPSTA
jgi:hypothetical protein